MSSPTEGTETPRPSAIWGSIPITTNSVVPMAKAPTDRGRSARGTGAGTPDGISGHDVRTDVVVRRGPGPAHEGKDRTARRVPGDVRDRPRGGGVRGLIGRAAVRGRVEISGGAVSFKK